MLLLDRALHQTDQLLQVVRCRLTMVDDEVRVLLGYGRITDPITLEARCLYESGGVIARRVGEDRTTAPFANGLRGLAPLEQLTHLGFVDAGLVLELQTRPDEPFV